MSLPNSDKPEIPLSEIHPETLNRLKVSMPLVRTIDAMAGPSEPSKLATAVDEMRRNFAGLDDLTLAAICSYFAKFQFSNATLSGDSLTFSSATAFASMALSLAWSLDES